MVREHAGEGFRQDWIKLSSSPAITESNSSKRQEAGIKCQTNGGKILNLSLWEKGWARYHLQITYHEKQGMPLSV